MKRYEIRKETSKNGRKKETYFGVYDVFEDRVIIRYSKEKEAQALIDKYEAMIVGLQEE